MSGAAVFWGRKQQDLVQSLAGSWGLVLLVLSGLLTLGAAIRFRRDLARASSEAAARGALESAEHQPMMTGLTLRRRRWPLVAPPSLRWSAPAAAAEWTASDGELAERVRLNERGLHGELERVCWLEDVFGLWRFTMRRRQARPVLSLPNTGRLTAADIAACLAYGDLLPHPYGRPIGDRSDFRTYNRSDPARLILWKVYARTRELMVRIPETARSPQQQPLVYLVAGPNDNAAAGLARLLMESGILGPGARLAADGTSTPVSEAPAVREAIAISRQHRQRSGHDLATSLADPGVAPDDPVVIVCPAIDRDWHPLVLRELGADPGRFVVLAAGDAAQFRPPQTRWQRWLFHAVPERRASEAQMIRALRPVVASGCRAALADRRSGRVVGLSEGLHGTAMRRSA
ncbi:MAG: DUF58 domain-containing protein [Acidobacteriota bacterium]|nr:MAG: DUF58 domain-containing protein [Acidobacteriota bacterium]